MSILQPDTWKKTAEQLQAETAYQNLIAYRQEREQARERAERLARDYSAGTLYVMPCQCDAREKEGEDEQP